MSWHGVNVELNFREATALEGHSREAIHLAAEVIADVTGYSRVELATLISIGRVEAHPARRVARPVPVRIHRRRDRATLSAGMKSLDPTPEREWQRPSRLGPEIP